MPTFSVANINPGLVRAEFMMSIIDLFQRQHTGVDSRVQFEQFYSHFAGPYLDTERNRCVAWFFANTQSDYLVFIDSDIGVAAKDVFDLVSIAADSPRGIYSGVYGNQFPGVDHARPVAYNQLGPNQTVESLEWKVCLDLADDNGIAPVDAVGAGFLCIPRKCLEAIGSKFESATPWFAEVAIGESYDASTHFGEDLTFCLRAAHVGWPTYLVTTLHAVHYKAAALRIQTEE